VTALVLGPLLRFIDATRATVWVETDAACRVEVLGAVEPTFAIEGHHYALVQVEGLEPGGAHPYEVHLDGERVWPEPDSDFPPSTIRPPRAGEPFALVFGSCRVTGPHETLPTSTRGFARQSSDVDALRTLGLRLRGLPPDALPDALLLLGDQVYADDVSPDTESFIATRGRRDGAPEDEVADFEEYTQLYREAWSEPVVRWLLSTLPTSMIFDDHDVHDDWNTSAAWVEEMRRKPWWQARIEGAMMSYWVYQHLGNLAPEDLADDTQYPAIRGRDGSEPLRAFARRADRESKGARWSYVRDFGRVRLLVLDSRSGRVLDGPTHRKMLDDAEFAWAREHAGADVDHLLVATTLPYLLPPALHNLEAWNEAVAAGRWGRRAARVGERMRQGADLEHWAAFEDSFRRLTELIREVAAGRLGRAPASLVVLSGDVHHAYLSRVQDPSGLESAVYQAVCSPMRHPMPRLMQWVYRVAVAPPSARLARWLARRAGVAPPPVTWQVDEGPWFDNQIATLSLHGRRADLRLERARLGADGAPRLDTLLDRPLTDQSADRSRAAAADGEPAASPPRTAG